MKNRAEQSKGLLACYEKSKEKLKHIKTGHSEGCSWRMTYGDGLCECLVKYPLKLIKNRKVVHEK